jgi:hypothetical protein
MGNGSAGGPWQTSAARGRRAALEAQVYAHDEGPRNWVVVGGIEVDVGRGRARVAEARRVRQSIGVNGLVALEVLISCPDVGVLHLHVDAGRALMKVPLW